MRQFLIASLATLAFVSAMLLGLRSASAAPAAPQTGGGGPAPCFCIASYTVTKTVDCSCSLQIVDLSWLASPNCAIFGNPNCPFSSNKRCELMADFAEVGSGCTGSWPDTRIRTKCESIKSVLLDCSGGGSHTVTLTCNPCALVQ